MPKTISIPILDHNAPGVCTANYNVRYQATGDAGWTRLLPAPAAPPIVIEGALDDTVYTIKISRTGCNGIISPEATVTAVTSNEIPGT